jgi:hypothetical protein
MHLPDPKRSLGYAAIAWQEHHLIHGPGDVQGEPIDLDVELSAFDVKAYEIDAAGRRVFDEAFFSRSKGRAKSEKAGMLVCFEFVGPARFSHWAADGETLYCPSCDVDFYRFDAGDAVGKPVVYPFIRCLATEEGQSGNTYDNVSFMLEDLLDRHGASFPGIDLGQNSQTSSRVFLRGGGEIRPSTASSASKDGGKETFSVFDEALALDTPLPTPTGWTTMGEVAVGDRIIGASGRPVRVLKVTDIAERRHCYRVTFRDGTSVVASAGHLWQTRVTGSAAKPKVRTTEEMFLDGRRFSLPANVGIDTDAIDLPIDPYILGLWLGDGDKNNATISVGDLDMAATTDNLERRGYTTRQCAGGNLLYVSLPGSTRNRFSKVDGLLVRLRHAGILGNKHIPQVYLRAGTEQRRELLRGLMDSDGFVSPSGHATFSNDSETLLDGITELLLSLGQRPGRGYQIDARSKVGRIGRIWFTPRWLQPFSLPRKASRVRPARMGEWDSIATIEATESVPVRCVAVDSEDHLFVAGAGWKVTHNTHLYVLPELRKMYDTVSRNGRKRKAAEPWILQTSTMYGIGEDSVAERTHKASRAGKLKRLYFDHVEAPADLDPEKLADRVKGLRICYGPAASWMPIDLIAADYDDPRIDRADWLRYFWNRAVAGTSDLTDGATWDSLAAENDLQAYQSIVLGFDGSRSDDSTALIGCRMSDGRVFELKVWERPPDAPAGWRVPRDEVDSMMTTVYDTYNVVILFGDPNKWEPYFDLWGSRWPKRVAEEWPSDKGTDRAVRLLLSAIKDRSLSHDGGSLLAQHIKAAALVRGRLRQTADADETDLLARYYLSIRKKGAGKIDAAWATMLAVKARGWALEHGFQEETSTGWGFAL